MTDTVVQLGPIAFANAEVPEQISFGGAQSLVVHKLVGGKRIVDAMGEDPSALEWSGLFIGSNALDRALYLDALRKAGKPLALTWSQLSYTVVIRELHCDFVRFYRLPYRIVCEVVSDLTSAPSQLPDPTTDDLVDDDMTSASALSDGIGDVTLSGLMTTLSAAISAAAPLATAAPSAVSSILVPLAATRGQVATMIASTDASISTSPAAVVSGAPIAQQAAAVDAQITAMTQQPSLISLDRTLGRIAANLASINSSSKSVTLAGTDLMIVAADQYGDAMGWAAIAAANGLLDPEILSVTTLSIPAYNAGANYTPGGWPIGASFGVSAASYTASSTGTDLTDGNATLVDGEQILVDG